MTGLLLPIANPLVTQPFGGHYYAESPGYLLSDRGGPLKGNKTYVKGWTKFTDLHLGIDDGCPVGTPIRAVADGLVVEAGTYTLTGEHFMQIRFWRDANSQAIFFITHLEPGGILIPMGHTVTQGQVVAKSGASGHVSGPHLHWEIRRAAATANPHLSGGWYRWNGKRLAAGGDQSGLPWVNGSK